MMEFIEETSGIYRLKIPFARIYTSVFLIKTEKCAVLVDFGAKESDVENYLSPALEKIGISYDSIKALVLTHNHSDHAGGLEKIKALAKNARLITTPGKVSDNISTISLKGHSNDSIGVLDRRTNTLITGDAVQGDGIDIYRGGIQNPLDYCETLKKIKRKKIENLLFSHAYDPWKKSGIFGRKNVISCLSDCTKYIK